MIGAAKKWVHVQISHARVRSASNILSPLRSANAPAAPPRCYPASWSIFSCCCKPAKRIIHSNKIQRHLFRAGWKLREFLFFLFFLFFLITHSYKSVLFFRGMMHTKSYFLKFQMKIQIWLSLHVLLFPVKVVLCTN